jgi:hypothetical protein
MRKEFPEIVRVHSIGNTWENRPIQMITLDMDPETSAKLAKKFTKKVMPKKP